MADDNKPLKPAWQAGRYMRYAIGEIVLVVIGILIALQINNWKEENQTKNEEQQALKHLIIDFKKNKKDLQELVGESNKSLNSSLTILNNTGNRINTFQEKEFDSLLIDIYFIKQFYPSNGSIDDLLNSGKLSIIRNSELRKKLSVWKSSLVEMRDWELKANNFEYKIIDYIIKNGNWLNTDEISNSPKEFNLPSSGFDIDNRVLLGEIQFENLIESRIIILEEVNLFQKRLLDNTTEIIQIIQNEILI